MLRTPGRVNGRTPGPVGVAASSRRLGNATSADHPNGPTDQPHSNCRSRIADRDGLLRVKSRTAVPGTVGLTRGRIGGEDLAAESPRRPDTGNPAACRVAVASTTDRPATSGIGTGAGPLRDLTPRRVSAAPPPRPAG